MTQPGLPLRADYKPRRAQRRRSGPPLVAAIIVVAVLVVVALFFVGMSIPSLFGSPQASPTPTPTETPTPTPTPTGPPVGPVPPGTYAWNELGGGECLIDYVSPWEEEFTVVPCTTTHDAQLVRRGELEGIPGSPYPGETAINEEMTLRCTDPAVLDANAVAAYTWVQWQAAYPPNVDEWNSGERAYFCFFNRSSGEPFTSSIVVAG